MVTAMVGFVIGVCVLVSLCYGYRTMTAGLVSWSLSSIDTDGPPQIVDGDPVAIEGELTVEEAVETGDAAVDGVDSPVGAYVWRARFPDNTNGRITVENWGWEKQHWHTFASGIELGRFGIVADDRTVRVEPGWLRDTYDSEPLDNLTAGGIDQDDRFSVDLWDSWYLFLRDYTYHLSLGRFEGVVQRHNDSINLARYLLESRPLVDGVTVSVRGEGHIEQGKPVIRGTDENPLVISDQGFDDHQRWLKKQAITKGAIATFMLLVAVGLWFGIYVPLYVLIVTIFIYILYNFIQDMENFV